MTERIWTPRAGNFLFTGDYSVGAELTINAELAF